MFHFSILLVLKILFMFGGVEDGCANRGAHAFIPPLALAYLCPIGQGSAINNRFEVFAIKECTFANTFQAFGERYALQFFAECKGIGIDPQKTLANGNRFEGVATHKCIAANSCYATGNGDVLKRRTRVECILTDNGNALGDCNIFERMAPAECVGTDKGQSFRQAYRYVGKVL